MVNNGNIGIIIQARMASSRLPGKVLLPMPAGSEYSILSQVVRLSQQLDCVKKVIIATSTNPENDVIHTQFQDQVEVFRGDEDDVLSRFYLIAEEHHLDIIVRLTADNPLIDPSHIQMALDEHCDKKADYTNTAGLPLGMNIEVISFKALSDAYRLGKEKPDREHVTHYTKSRQDIYQLNTLYFDEGEDSQLRLTVDNPDDYALSNLIYAYLSDGGEKTVRYPQLKELVQAKPWLKEINQGNFQKKAIYHTLEDEIEDACEVLSKNGFSKIQKVLLDKRKEGNCE